MDLSQSHVLVTGGGAGIGRHLVEQLAHAAGRVAVFEKNESAIADIERQYPAIMRAPKKPGSFLDGIDAALDAQRAARSSDTRNRR